MMMNKERNQTACLEIKFVEFKDWRSLQSIIIIHLSDLKTITIISKVRQPDNEKYNLLFEESGKMLEKHLS